MSGLRSAGAGVRGRLAVVAALALAACVPPKVPPPDLSLDPAALLAQVRAADGRVTSVQGSARVRITSKERSGALAAWVAAERPDRIHVETLDFFGNPAAVMVADGRRFTLYDAREKVVYVGAPTPANLARLVPLRVSADELVQVLCGSAPLAPGTPASATPGPGVVTLRIDAGPLAQVVDVGPGAGVVSARTLGPGGAPAPGAVEVAFGARAPVDGVPFPDSATLSAPDRGVRVALEWKSPKVNRPVDPALFRLEPPRGARVVDLGEGAPTPESPPLLERPGGRAPGE